MSDANSTQNSQNSVLSRVRKRLSKANEAIDQSQARIRSTRQQMTGMSRDERIAQAQEKIKNIRQGFDEGVGMPNEVKDPAVGRGTIAARQLGQQLAQGIQGQMSDLDAQRQKAISSGQVGAAAKISSQISALNAQSAQKGVGLPEEKPELGQNVQGLNQPAAKKADEANSQAIAKLEEQAAGETDPKKVRMLRIRARNLRLQSGQESLRRSIAAGMDPEAAAAVQENLLKKNEVQLAANAVRHPVNAAKTALKKGVNKAAGAAVGQGVRIAADAIIPGLGEVVMFIWRFIPRELRSLVERFFFVLLLCSCICCCILVATLVSVISGTFVQHLTDATQLAGECPEILKLAAGTIPSRPECYKAIFERVTPDRISDPSKAFI